MTLKNLYYLAFTATFCITTGRATLAIIIEPKTENITIISILYSLLFCRRFLDKVGSSLNRMVTIPSPPSLLFP